MSIVDLTACLMVLLGFLRGFKTKIEDQLYRLIRIGFPMITGCGLFGFVKKVLGFVPGLDAEHTGFFGFMGVIAISFLALRKGTKKLRSYFAERFGDQPMAGLSAVVGGVRCIVLVVSILFGLALSPARSVVEGSFLGKLILMMVGREPT